MCFIFREWKAGVIIMHFWLDAGHRNSVQDFGACGHQQRESEIALSIVLKLGDLLEKTGHKVSYTRKTETEVISLTKRVKNANAIANIDYFLSIHINSFKDEKSNGFEVWHYGDQEELASRICKNTCDLTKQKNRGAKISQDFIVLRDTKSKALLIECGFISNYEECQNLLKQDFQDNIIKSILKSFDITIPDFDADNKIPLILNNKLVYVNAINKDDTNYVKLRDLADDFIEVGYDMQAKLPYLNAK